MARDFITTAEEITAFKNSALTTVDMLEAEFISQEGKAKDYQEVIYKLQTLLPQILDDEEHFLQAIGCSGDRAAAKEKVRQFYEESKFSVNFSGKELRYMYAEYLNDDEYLRRLEAAEFLETLVNWCREKLQQEYLERLEAQHEDSITGRITESVDEWTLEQLKGEVLSTINEVSGRASVASRKLSSTTFLEDKEGEVIISKITEAMKDTIQRMLEVLRNQGPLVVQGKKTSLNYTINKEAVQELINTIGYTVTPRKGFAQATIDIGKSFTIKGAMEAIAGKKTTSSNKPKGQQLTRLNEKMKQGILAKIDPNYAEAAKAVIEYMLGQNPEMFLVGYSVNQLVGLLGEIGTIMAMSHLLDKPVMECVRWCAQNTVGGKQLSIDAILEADGIKIGVQSKHSGHNPDSIIDITFLDRDSYDLFTQLGWGFDVAEQVEKIFATDQFNIQYHMIIPQKRNKPHAESGTVSSGAPDWVIKGEEDYQQAIEIIHECTNRIHRYLYQFAPSMLYMNLGRNFDDLAGPLLAITEEAAGVSGNSIYIVATKLHFASEMLGDIQADLKALKTLEDKAKTFSVHSVLERVEEGNDTYDNNIITYKNKEGLSKYKTRTSATYHFNKKIGG